MPGRLGRLRKLIKVSVNLPQSLVDALDDLADEVETDRTDVIQEFLEYGLENVDDVFPLESDEAELENTDQEESEQQQEEERTHDPEKVNRLHRGGGLY